MPGSRVCLARVDGGGGGARYTFMTPVGLLVLDLWSMLRGWGRAAGDPKKNKDYLPPDKQYLITRRGEIHPASPTCRSEMERVLCSLLHVREVGDVPVNVFLSLLLWGEHLCPIASLSLYVKKCP